MTYLERYTEIQEKITHGANIAGCALEMSELILDMANKIESLEDELRDLDERLYLRKAFGD